MLKRSFGLALIAVAGAIIWFWVRRRQDDLANMHHQFAPPDLNVRPAASALPNTAVVVPAIPSETIDRPTWPGHGRRPAAEPARPAAAPQAATAPAAEAEPEAPAAAAPVAEVEPEAPAVDVEPEAPIAEAELEAPVAGTEQAAPAEEQAEEEQAPAEDDELSSSLEGVVGYCVRCKTKRPIEDAHEETTESGRRAARGTCPVCGANMFTFLKEEA